jgi:hypothetical protein
MIANFLIRNLYNIPGATLGVVSNVYIVSEMVKLKK